ncbi:MAG: helix-turn-helix transcriptional regulator [Ruminiclostridium sp.]|nr:helix-turn-helix transcriptional regulator [Ruminiclostridium sp.]
MEAAAAVRETAGDIIRPDTGRIKELLRSGSLDSCGQVLDDVLKQTGFFNIQSFMVRLYICMDIFVAAKDFASEIGVTDEQFTRRFGTVRDIEKKMIGAGKMAEYLYETISQCIMWRASSVRDSFSDAVEKAKAYIDSNYMNYDISLRTVADSVGLSPAYLSGLFKKEAGQNLSDYLTDVRINKAKSLLCCTSKMVYEVAYEVGFHDYKYFSQIFKKHTGQTPRQFQNSANVC